MKGKVARWSDERGFGFIDGPKDRVFFVHYTQILGDGYKTLAAGQEVEFDGYETDMGWEAKDVRKC